MPTIERLTASEILDSRAVRRSARPAGWAAARPPRHRSLRAHPPARPRRWRFAMAITALWRFRLPQSRGAREWRDPSARWPGSAFADQADTRPRAHRTGWHAATNRAWGRMRFWPCRWPSRGRARWRATGRLCIAISLAMLGHAPDRLPRLTINLFSGGSACGPAGGDPGCADRTERAPTIDDRWRWRTMFIRRQPR